jgi:opacity protein-like surface antigen
MKLIAIAAASAMLVAGASASPSPDRPARPAPATANWAFTTLKMYAGVDYMRCFKKNDTKIDGFTIGLGYRF